MPPYASYLVYGDVYNADGFGSSEAVITIFTSISTIGTKPVTTGTDGVFVFDLANYGYTSGETVSVSIEDKYRNQVLTTTFVVTGAFQNINWTLAYRTDAFLPNANIAQTPMLHTVGKKPVTADNPLSVKTSAFLENFYPSDQLTSGPVTYNGYLDRDGRWYITEQNTTTGTFRYAKGSSNYSNNWDNRAGLSYGYFNEVF